MYDVYLAGPFFCKKEVEYIKQCERILRDRGFHVFSPREHFIENGDILPNHIWGKKVFEMDKKAIEQSKYFVTVYHGMYSDSGTAWESGYAYAIGKPVMILCPDDMSIGSVMIMNGAHCICYIDELKTFDFEEFPMKVLPIEQK